MNVNLIHINKHFGHVQANANISLRMQGGRIYGILGENGAGKSTLMKILSGYIQPDSGEIMLDGEAVSIDSPADAIKYGIGMLHQDPLDFPPMQVIENFILGDDGGLVLSYRKTLKEFEILQNQFDFSLNPKTYIDTMTVGERQQLEILRLLWLGARVLILDEPTTGISAQQKEKLFRALKVLAENGKTVIFVSHKLEDVEHLCDRVAILRDGFLVGEAKPPYHTDKLVEMMFGKQVTLPEPRSYAEERVVLDIEDLKVEKYPLKIGPVNFKLHAGEVVGLAGMEGSGQNILLRACVGLLRPIAGRVIVNGQDMTRKDYLDYLARGVSYLPASRLEEGLVPGLSLAEHFTVKANEGSLFIDKKKYRKKAKEKIDEYHIIGRPETSVESLSGGNQQRAALSLMEKELEVVLLEHPTRGLDLESAVLMWEKLKERCKLDTSVFFISADLDEILRYSDRILVFFSGHVSRPFDAAQINLEKLGELIGGKGWGQTLV